MSGADERAGTAIVTGAGGGIGVSIVRELRGVGFNVVATDVAEALERAPLHELDRVHLHAVDLRRPESSSELVTVASERFGDLDLVVNNAVVSRYEPFLEIQRASWDEMVEVGLTSYFFLAQAAARHMVGAGHGGSIVNLASVNSFAAEAGAAHYAVIKGGVANMTRALCVELGSHDIRVNAIAPGPIRTPVLAPIQDSEAFAPVRSRIPLGRIGSPEEIASAVIFLASAGASYISGAVLLADGGLLSAL